MRNAAGNVPVAFGGWGTLVSRRWCSLRTPISVFLLMDLQTLLRVFDSLCDAVWGSASGDIFS